MLIKIIYKFLLFQFSILVAGCEPGQRYTYIKVILLERNPGDSVTRYMRGERIFAESDSAAYLLAYSKYAGSVLVKSSIDKDNPNSKFRVLGFQLIDENGSDIANTITFANKEEKERRIMQELRDEVLPAITNSN